MAQSVSRIHIKAQPQASYRERYYSELDPGRNRPQRFIRTDPNLYNLDYPTIEIAQEWNNKQKLYICVTLVTVPTEEIPVTCIHPYPIDTPEINMIKDAERNTLYFPILEDDFSRGQKSFRIIRKKLIQYELRNYGQLRLLNTDERDIQRLNDTNDARGLIGLYQLGKSQLIFSLAALVCENQLPIIYAATSISSNIMTAVIPTNTTNDEDLSIRYVPKRGYWHGGDEILMSIPKLDKRKTCKVIFGHSLMNQTNGIPIDFVDTKTISFVTPPCPIQATGNQRLQIPIVVMQGTEEIARVNFLYQSFDSCLACHTNLMVDSCDESNIYEQSTVMDLSVDDTDIFLCDHDQNIETENDRPGK